MEQLEKTVELSLLYDFYGGLLNEHKRQIFEDYILNDLSLSEIAESAGITRQGVHDVIKSSEKSLYRYEETLHLVEKYKFTVSKCEEIKRLADDCGQASKDKIYGLVEEIKNNGI